MKNSKVLPVKYVIDEVDWSVYISARKQRDGTLKWVVEEIGVVLNKHTGEWDYEPMPSERSDEFIEATRFDSAGEALHKYDELFVKGDGDVDAGL